MIHELLNYISELESTYNIKITGKEYLKNSDADIQAAKKANPGLDSLIPMEKFAEAQLYLLLLDIWMATNLNACGTDNKITEIKILPANNACTAIPNRYSKGSKQNILKFYSSDKFEIFKAVDNLVWAGLEVSIRCGFIYEDGSACSVLNEYGRQCYCPEDIYELVDLVEYNNIVNNSTTEFNAIILGAEYGKFVDVENSIGIPKYKKILGEELISKIEELVEN